MSASTEPEQSPDKSSPEPAPKHETTDVIEIDIENLSDTQKFVLLSVPVVFVVQLFFLLNLKVFTDFFKGMIVGDYVLIPDYVKNFIVIFTPYLLLVFVFFALYSAYVILINDLDYMKFLNKILFYLFVALFVVFILFFMSASTVDPYTTELFLFLFMTIVMIIIEFLPFGLYDLLEERAKKTGTTSSNASTQ